MRLHIIVGLLVTTAFLRCVAKEAELQTVRGTLVPAEIDVPATWHVAGTNGGVIAVRGDGMQIMLSSNPQEVGGTSAAAKIACDGARQIMPDAVCTEPRPVTIAGRDWLEYVVTGTVEKQAMTFLNYTYAGRIGTFTIIGQVRTVDFPEKQDALSRYMKSFRFPK